MIRYDNLNSIQKTIFWAAFGVIVLMGLIPPWSRTFNYEGSYSENHAGFSFIFSPPEPFYRATFGIKLNFSLLFLEWLLVVIVAVALGFFFHGYEEDLGHRPNPSPPKPGQNREALERRLKEALQRVKENLSQKQEIKPPGKNRLKRILFWVSLILAVSFVSGFCRAFSRELFDKLLSR